jgi:hypothetical protein
VNPKRKQWAAELLELNRARARVLFQSKVNRVLFDEVGCKNELDALMLDLVRDAARAGLQREVMGLVHDAIVHEDATRAAFQRNASAPRGLMVDFCLPRERAEDVLNNLLGGYEDWVERHGQRAARRIFAIQSFGVIFSFWFDWVLQRAKLLWLLLGG